MTDKTRIDVLSSKLLFLHYTPLTIFTSSYLEGAYPELKDVQFKSELPNINGQNISVSFGKTGFLDLAKANKESENTGVKVRLSTSGFIIEKIAENVFTAGIRVHLGFEYESKEDALEFIKNSTQPFAVPVLNKLSFIRSSITSATMPFPLVDDLASELFKGNAEIERG